MQTKCRKIWGKKEDDLVIGYLSTVGIPRERYALKLRPVINNQSQIILFNYFPTLCNWNAMNLIKDCSSKLFMSLERFDIEKGKAFSFLQTTAKNYYMDLIRIEERYGVIKTLAEKRQSLECYQTIIDVLPDADLITGSTIQYLTSKTFKLPVYQSMRENLLSLLRDDTERSYERFVLDLYELCGEPRVKTFVSQLKTMGFNFPNVEKIINGAYKDTHKVPVTAFNRDIYGEIV